MADGVASGGTKKATRPPSEWLTVRTVLAAYPSVIPGICLTSVLAGLSGGLLTLRGAFMASIGIGLAFAGAAKAGHPPGVSLLWLYASRFATYLVACWGSLLVLVVTVAALSFLLDWLLPPGLPRWAVGDLVPLLAAYPVLGRIWPAWALPFVVKTHEGTWGRGTSAHQWFGPGLLRAIALSGGQAARPYRQAVRACLYLLLASYILQAQLAPASAPRAVLAWLTALLLWPTTVIASTRGTKALWDRQKVKDGSSSIRAKTAAKADDEEPRSRPARRERKREPVASSNDDDSREELVARCGGADMLFYVAALGDSPQYIERLLKHASDPSGRGEMQQTALHVAFRRGNTRVVTRLLEVGADVCARDSYGVTPLHCLAMHPANLPFLQILLDKGAALEANDGRGATPLHYAAGRSCLPVLRALVSAGADVQAIDNQGETALHKVAAWYPSSRTLPNAMSEHLGVIDFLCQAGVPIDWKNAAGQTALLKAAAGAEPETIERLLRRGARHDDEDARGLSPLQLAAFATRLDSARRMLAAGAVLDVRSAVCLGDRDAVASAVAADPSLLRTRGSWQLPSLVALAVHHGQRNVLEDLLAGGAELNGVGPHTTPLLCAIAHHQDAALAIELLARGADPRVADGDGFTPLHRAAGIKAPALVEALLGQGADPDARSERGQKPTAHPDDHETRRLLETARR